MEPGEYARMDAAEARMWWYRSLHARILDAVAGVHGRVLDAGCGTGGLLAALRRDRPDLMLFGIEFAAAAAPRARAKSAACIARGSVNTLPFADHSFDAAIAADVLCHAAVDPQSALAELHRVLRPGALLVVNMPAFAWLHSAHDRAVHNARRWSAGQTRAALLAADFAVPRTRYWNGLLLPLMVLQRKLLARDAAAGSDVALFSPWLDATLHAITAIERHARLNPPAGGSVLATATRP
jgi:SAM-dependent methyltransferase